jgi:triosephosphate isomerase
VNRTRPPLIAGNWKLHHGGASGIDLAVSVARTAAALPGVEVVIAPPFTALAPVVSECRELARQLGVAPIGVSAQDLHHEPQGPFTGEVSAPMLAEIGVGWAIIGHSERRQYFGDTDEWVAKKTRAALAADLTPIVCVGETLEEREAGRTLAVVLAMVDAVLPVISGGRAVIAYEPVWAIGTGRVATPSDAQEVHEAIRARLGAALGERTRIVYGGSVKADNARELLAQPDIDGVLVGGASLTIGDFSPILRAAAALLG